MEHAMATRRITSTKLLGDAGEHYALSQFSFAGKYAAKMPDNWEGYDLAVETGAGLIRVSVKTRSETAGWKASRWFNWDDRKACDWFVFIFKPLTGALRSWVIPAAVVEHHANKPGSNRKDPWFRDLSWKKLNQPLLGCYEDNWVLQVDWPTAESADDTTSDLSSLLIRVGA
jgi:hypothetical protein